jgi:hypothetical protein
MQRVKPGEDKIAGGTPCKPPKRRGVVVYLQACDEYDEAKNKRNQHAVSASAMKYGYVAGVQLHKILGVE